MCRIESEKMQILSIQNRIKLIINQSSLLVVENCKCKETSYNGRDDYVIY